MMRRVLADANWTGLEGTDYLCRIALDQLAQDESLPGAKAALWRDMKLQLATPEDRSTAGAWALVMMLGSDAPQPAFTKMAQSGIHPQTRDMLRYPLVQSLLAADYVAGEVSRDPASILLRELLPEPLIRDTAAQLRNDPQALVNLRNVLTGAELELQATAASLLHAVSGNWKPSRRRAPQLAGAHLPGVQWHGIRLVQLDISCANLTEADLSEARLKDVTALSADLYRARLHGASLTRLVATKALFCDADLSFVRAPQAEFQLADLRGANLEGALLTDATFEGALLQGARFRRANLTHACLGAAILDDAEFSGADLSRADLPGAVLRVADFTGAQFAHANLTACDLENMRLPGANFDHADMCGSLLTGSHMPSAKFRGADLQRTGLAEIEWERADLRGADLRGATFHLGSSRSGLVDSPIACEGSRTGFYTDELHEQDFKSPEEIRKANLCGADLYGANIEGVDFYLVDLRGARYSWEQEQHFRHCGAILETRV
ncbi:MAG: pentapeptide repeat-containing protein [Planctomycetia bacterium]|nr:pentapeptide repeat-containing protein [Planctomycetia bacterium]